MFKPYPEIKGPWDSKTNPALEQAIATVREMAAYSKLGCQMTRGEQAAISGGH